MGTNEAKPEVWVKVLKTEDNELQVTSPLFRYVEPGIRYGAISYFGADPRPGSRSCSDGSRQRSRYKIVENDYVLELFRIFLKERQECFLREAGVLTPDPMVLQMKEAFQTLQEKIERVRYEHQCVEITHDASKQITGIFEDGTPISPETARQVIVLYLGHRLTWKLGGDSELPWIAGESLHGLAFGKNNAVQLAGPANSK
ncbi:MAG: hypothetical protein L6R42_003151 [Xanthoria sp. 1 TBL-2021]|nr:MAG: hypothetical protein L6R42_003151 [Xanthoria sp. 1 TBL-2021]